MRGRLVPLSILPGVEYFAMISQITSLSLASHACLGKEYRVHRLNKDCRQLHLVETSCMLIPADGLGHLLGSTFMLTISV